MRACHGLSEDQRGLNEFLLEELETTTVRRPISHLALPDLSRSAFHNLYKLLHITYS